MSGHCSKKRLRGSLAWRQSLRARLAEMQRYRCAYCLCDVRDNPTLDHVWPNSKRGGSSYENCVVACYECNTGKGADLCWRQYKVARSARRAHASGARWP
jgi:5-methylcytosine-specific restriction endonuclease McrA